VPSLTLSQFKPNNASPKKIHIGGKRRNDTVDNGFASIMSNAYQAQFEAEMEARKQQESQKQVSYGDLLYS
jgi:hypothetical protein